MVVACWNWVQVGWSGTCRRQRRDGLLCFIVRSQLVFFRKKVGAWAEVLGKQVVRESG